MNTYITGAVIKELREKKGLTQEELARRIGVTGKAVSKWETGKGLPDISLLEPLSSALGASVIELMKGETVVNRNRSSNMMKTRFYVCPVCGNIVHAVGNALISCCGITLPALEAEAFDDAHAPTIEMIEDERFISFRHDMSKTHFISFLAFVSNDRVQMIKFYPEGNAETRIQKRGHGDLYAYCNKHGLMKQRL
ncbi:MAG: helix-turn-helix domain-containing protein [Clostridia bacterium]|nr:helix-turn-helix domain-containing protein [Clostridia bacterium]